MTRATPYVLAMLGLAACASGIKEQPKNACALIRLAEMPIEAREHMLFTHATIGGEPVTVLVDTGAERTLLTEAAVKRLRLPRDFQHPTRTFGIGSPTSSWDATLPDGLVLGETHFPVDSVTVGNFSIDNVAGVSADGLLGADVLLGFDLDLDLPARRITFYRPRPECSDPAPPWKQPYSQIAGVTTRGDRLLVPFMLDGVTGEAVLDTGAQVSTISQRMVGRIGLAEDRMADDRTVIAHGAAPDQITVHIHQFRMFRVGNTEMADPVLPVVPMLSGMGDALLGADFLQGRRVWLSFATERVFVTPFERSPRIAETQAGD